MRQYLGESTFALVLEPPTLGGKRFPIASASESRHYLQVAPKVPVLGRMHNRGLLVLWWESPALLVRITPTSRLFGGQRRMRQRLGKTNSIPRQATCLAQRLVVSLAPSGLPGPHGVLGKLSGIGLGKCYLSCLGLASEESRLWPPWLAPAVCLPRYSGACLLSVHKFH